MRLINLLPEELREKKSGSFLILPPEIIKLIFIGIVIAVFFGAWRVVLKSKIDQTKAELAEIEAAWKATEGLVKERGDLLEQKKEAEKGVIFLQQFLSRDIIWSEKFKQLVRVTPPEMWFEELVLQKENSQGQQSDKITSKKSLQLYAHIGFLNSDDEMLAKINTFVEDIKKNKDFYQNFEALNMLDLRKDNRAKQPVINFKIKMGIKD